MLEFTFSYPVERPAPSQSEMGQAAVEFCLALTRRGHLVCDVELVNGKPKIVFRLAVE